MKTPQNNQVIAALYVQTGGAYFDLPNVDPWDEQRDAREYKGPHPVVAHPPCQRWGRFWFGCPLTVKRTVTWDEAIEIADVGLVGGLLATKALLGL